MSEGKIRLRKTSRLGRRSVRERKVAGGKKASGKKNHQREKMVYFRKKPSKKKKRQRERLKMFLGTRHRKKPPESSPRLFPVSLLPYCYLSHPVMPNLQYSSVMEIFNSTQIPTGNFLQASLISNFWWCASLSLDAARRINKLCME